MSKNLLETVIFSWESYLRKVIVAKIHSLGLINLIILPMKLSKREKIFVKGILLFQVLLMLGRLISWLDSTISIKTTTMK